MEALVGVLLLWGRDLGGLLGGRKVGLVVGLNVYVLIVVHWEKNFACRVARSGYVD